MARISAAHIMTRHPPQHLDERLASVLGDKTAAPFASKLGIQTVGDLLRHLPRRYDQRGELTDIAELQIDEQVTILARVKRADSRRMAKRRGTIQTIVVTDGHADLTLTFFNQPFRVHQLSPGAEGIFTGKVSVYRGTRQLTHPNFVPLEGIFDEGEPRSSDDDTRERAADAADAAVSPLIPIYPATEQLPTWTISKCVKLVLDQLGDVPDPVPEPVRERRGVLALDQTFRQVHRPTDWAQVQQARQRFRYEEAFVLQCELARRRHAARELQAHPRTPAANGLLTAFDAGLPFALTEGQREIGATVQAELARTFPMHRLLQGEVGSGKTVVALRAMLTVVDAGGQAALLAPTEVLAAQHYRSIRELMGPLAEQGMLGGSEHGTTVTLLTGSLGAKARRTALLGVASGEAGIVVGTHALLEEQVTFADLGLVVVDEQHRFGVEQRAALTEKAGQTPPHLLVMTATPIPRTVAMTVFGDLEVSTLRELPSGRAEVQSTVVPLAEKPSWRERVWQRVREEVGKGHQAYVVCPRIGDDDAVVDPEEEPAGEQGVDELPVEPGVESGGESGTRPTPQAVIEVAAELTDGPLADLRIAVLHGRLSTEHKDATMRRFAQGEIDVLVATTVIEVGVDVPNASTMVILDADWFGASQLHQLRGRIGRGDVPGLCLLVSQAAPGTPARERLDAVAGTRDGFELSRRDLQQRREGDVLGADQSGRRSSLRSVAVLRDEDLIADARDDATALVDEDPGLAAYPTLAAAVAALTDDERASYLEKS